MAVIWVSNLFQNISYSNQTTKQTNKETKKNREKSDKIVFLKNRIEFAW